MAEDNVIEFRLEAVDQFSAQFKDLLGSLGAVGKGLLAVATVAAAAGGALFAITKKAADLQDEVDALSDKLGLSVQYLSEMRHVAQQMDVPIDSMNKGLQFLTRNLGEAVNGNIAMSREFTRMGISVTDAQGRVRSIDQLMPELSDKFKAMGSDAERVRVAMQLFGRSGAEMIPMLRGGSDAINKLRQDAEFLGVSMNKQATANASLMNDQINRFKMAVQGSVIATGNEMIPLFSGIFNKLANWLAENREAFKKFGEYAATAIIGTIVAVQMLWQSLKDLWASIKSGTINFIEGLGLDPKQVASAINTTFKVLILFLKGMVTLFVEGFKLIWNSFVELGKYAWQNMKAIFGKGKAVSLEDVIGNLGQHWEKFNNKMTSVNKEAWAIITDDSKTAIDAISSGVVSKDFASEFASRMAAMRKELTMTATVEQEQVKQTAAMTLLERYKMHQNNLALMQEELAARVYYASTWQEAASLGMQQWLLSQQNLAQQVATLMQQTMTTLVQGIGNAVAQAVVYGQKLSDLMKSLLKQIAAEIISTLVRIGVQQVLTSLIGAKAQTAAGIAAVYTNSFASAAAIPLTGWAIAPGIATSNAALAKGVSAGLLAGAAHGGLDYVPSESTYLLDKGERVLSPNQNRDLTGFLSGDQGGGGTRIEQLSINVAAADAQSFLRLTPADWREIVAKGVIPGLDALNKQGVRPNFISEQRR